MAPRLPLEAQTRRDQVDTVEPDLDFAWEFQGGSCDFVSENHLVMLGEIIYP